MSNKSRWTQEEELLLIKSIAFGDSLDAIALTHNRTPSAIELRLKKIIYENASSGKSLDGIAKLLKLSEDKIRQYFYAYKEFKEKHVGLVDVVHAPTNPKRLEIVDGPQKGSVSANTESLKTDKLIASGQRLNENITQKLQFGGEKNHEDHLTKIESRLKKLEIENRILKLVVDNKELTHKLNKLIKDGKIDGSIKTAIKKIRES